MAVISPALNAAYFDITKVGSSSVKEALWRLETGEPFAGTGLTKVRNHLRWRLARAGLAEPRNIHEEPGYRNQRYDLAQVPDGYARFTLVRDPAARLRSAWRDKINRAQFEWRGEVMDLEADGLPLDPSFGEFIDHFELYRSISRPVRVHVTPYSWHLGSNLKEFDQVFRIEDGGALAAWMSDQAGHSVELPRENSSAGEVRDDRLSVAQIEKLFVITAPDYALLGDLYDADAAAEMFRARSAA